MRGKVLKGILLFAITGSMFYSCKKSDDNSSPPAPAVVMSARDLAVQDYNTNFLGSNVTNPGWTGSTFSCDAGTAPQSTHNAVIKRINYFRRLVGLNDNCTLDTSRFAEEQQTALMMHANNQLSHSPPNTWSCWTSLGSSGAGSSNLALGSHSSNAVTLFINDYGSGNTAVGHRRWLLHSLKTAFSYGTTDNAMAIYVFGAGGNTQIPPFIAYPPKGYIPQQLVYNRWSFSIPGAEFSTANVTMTGPSGAVSLLVNTVVDGYGDNTIVWEPTGINTSSITDVTYTVTITGVGNTSSSTYTYNVTLIKP